MSRSQRSSRSPRDRFARPRLQDAALLLLQPPQPREVELPRANLHRAGEALRRR